MILRDMMNNFELACYYIVVGNGAGYRELIDELDDEEVALLIRELKNIPIRAKIALRKLGCDDLELYAAEEEFFEKVSYLHDVFHGRDEWS